MILEQEIQLLTEEFSLQDWQVKAVIELLDAGNTIPFIARYRKEMTGSLDDQLLRRLSERLEYVRGLEKRREEIIAALESLGVQDAKLTKQLDAAKTLSELEDLYRPYRPKRRTRASIAKERGLQPLADWLMKQYPAGDAEARAAQYLNGEVADAEAALAGARDIIAEQISDDAAVRKVLRGQINREAKLSTHAADDAAESVYTMYYNYNEDLSRAPAHRILAINRGEKEGFLKVGVQPDEQRAKDTLHRSFVLNRGAGAKQVEAACDDAWSRLLYPSLERETRGELTDRANEQAIRVFADNLKQLLMQPPVKGHVTLGVDPGFRTGCKLAVVDATGKVLETGVGHFTLPGQEEKKARSREQIRSMIRRHNVTAIAIGNGTASRESEQFIADTIRDLPGVAYAIVSEAGASVYSASETAAEEFPDFDVTLRSAVSIARRLQDPLAELVKIDPKALGIGQYQHDLKQKELEETLDGVVEMCVNAVGVDVSTASAPLLSHVAGIGPALAKNIVAYRDANGIASRAALKKVPKLGPRAFEQCAGFLRVTGGREALDATAVHPEHYAEAKQLLKLLGETTDGLKNGGIAGIRKKAEAYGMEKLAAALELGLPTLSDIVSELERPGRDPREDLPTPVLRTDVLSMKDLKKGMKLKGTVRNVTDFGAFVDIGVHQDGLVHISRLTERFLKHPSQVVKVGDVVDVWVVDVDEKKNRIALTMVESRQ